MNDDNNQTDPVEELTVENEAFKKLMDAIFLPRPLKEKDDE